MPDYTINAVIDALRTLTIFDYFNTSYSLTEIAKLTELPKSKVVRLLYTLEQMEFIVRSPETGAYSLGPSAERMGRVARVRDRVRHIVQDVMWRLRDRWLETVNFGVIQHNRVVYAAIVDSPHPFRVVEQIGDIISVSKTAIGRAILAIHPHPSVLCPADVLAELQPLILDVRSKGYALDNEEVELGVRCIGVSVRDGDGTILGGLSVSGPATRLTSEMVNLIGLDLVNASNEITENLKALSTDSTVSE